MAVPPQSAKSELRRFLKTRRETYVSTLDHVMRSRLDRDLAAIVCAGIGSRPGVIAAYLAIGSEIDPSVCLDRLRLAGWTIALPRVPGRDAPMTFHRHDRGAALAPGPLGLRQPLADAPECTPDIVLAPLLGFTADGVRIGYGAGHYDRALAQNPNARRIGIAWDAQLCESLPEDAWDVRLHAVATPTRWIDA